MTDGTLTPIIGNQVGNYRILKELGAGAMGEVFLGEHPQIGSKVAVKVLALHLSTNPEMAQRFMSEARAANQISHPNIIRINDFGQLPDSRLYLVMEYLDGEEMTDYLKNHAPLTIGETREMLRQVTSAMQAAHDVNIVHRDLKPDNIFLHKAGNEHVVKVLDFGIAKLLESDMGGSHQTSTGMIMGTPLYMSPEQAAGQVKDISARSDIYAIGVILYQMLSGALPITGPTAAQILAGHIAEAPTPLETVAQGLPPQLYAVVAQCLEKQPDHRFQRAADLFEAFDSAIVGLDPAFQATVLEPSDGSGTVSYGSQPSGASASGMTSKAPGYMSRPAGSASQPGGTTGHPTSVERPAGAGYDTGEPSTFRNAAGESLVRPLPEEAPRKSKLGLFIGIGVVAVAAIVLVVLQPWKSKDEAPSESEPAASAMEPPMRVVEPPRRVMEPPMRPRPRSFTIKVVSKTSGAKITAQVGDRKPEVKKVPFSLTLKAGEKLTVKASRRGFASKETIVVAEADREVDLTLSRAGRRRRRRVVRVAPRPRPVVMRRRPAMRRVGAGTLGLD